MVVKNIQQLLDDDYFMRERRWDGKEENTFHNTNVLYFTNKIWENMAKKLTLVIIKRCINSIASTLL